MKAIFLACLLALTAFAGDEPPANPHNNGSVVGQNPETTNAPPKGSLKKNKKWKKAKKKGPEVEVPPAPLPKD